MGRDEYLATSVMGWEQRDWLGSLWWDDSLRKEGIYERIMLCKNWNPGKSWSQTGMILEAMEEDFRIEIYRNTRRFPHTRVGSLKVILSGLKSCGTSGRLYT